MSVNNIVKLGKNYTLFMSLNTMEYVINAHKNECKTRMLDVIIDKILKTYSIYSIWFVNIVFDLKGLSRWSYTLTKQSWT